MSTLFGSNAANCPITTYTLQTKDAGNVYSDYSGSSVALAGDRIRVSTASLHTGTYWIKAESASGNLAYQEVSITVVSTVPAAIATPPVVSLVGTDVTISWGEATTNGAALDAYRV